MTRYATNRTWGLVIACALILSVCCIIQLRTVSRRFLQRALSVHEDAGYLRITWSGGSLAEPATLEIIDGGRDASVPIFPGLSSVTYQPLTSDVQVRLGTDATRFVGWRPRTAASDIEELDAEVESLTAAAAVRRRRILELEKAIAKVGSVSNFGASDPERKYAEELSLRKLTATGTRSPAH